LFEQILNQALQRAETSYDQVIRRWGNIPFAQSTVYDWVWSEEFVQLCEDLTELETGCLRIRILEIFGVRPWPWYSSSRLQGPPHEY